MPTSCSYGPCEMFLSLFRVRFHEHRARGGKSFVSSDSCPAEKLACAHIGLRQICLVSRTRLPFPSAVAEVIVSVCACEAHVYDNLPTGHNSWNRPSLLRRKKVCGNVRNLSLRRNSSLALYPNTTKWQRVPGLPFRRTIRAEMRSA